MKTFHAAENGDLIVEGFIKISPEGIVTIGEYPEEGYFGLSMLIASHFKKIYQEQNEGGVYDIMRIRIHKVRGEDDNELQ